MNSKMSKSSFFCISCDFYKQNIFPGLTRLQEQQEFVDLTLAADGHIVKVHKNIVALASPYIKEILKTASGDSPVIFLNNVKHDVLKYLLEYIYQGEVNVPKESIEAFMQLSQSLHITGMARQDILNVSRQDQYVDQSMGTNTVQKQIPTLLRKKSQDQNSMLPQQQTQNLYQKEFVNRIGINILDQQDQNTSQVVCGNQNSGINIVQQQSQNNFKEIYANQISSNTVIQQDPNSSQEECESQNLEVHPVQGTFKNNGIADSLAACITINNDQNVEIQKMANIPISNIEIDKPNDVFTSEAIQAMPVVLNTENGLENPVTNVEMDSWPQSDVTNTTIAKEPTINPSIQILDVVTINSINAPVDLNNLDKESIDALKTITQYSTTERGSVQIIVSRYIYNRHHSSMAGRKHRWRCLDYRGLHCKAYIDSLDGRIIARKGLHDHGFHDDKINKKHSKGQISHSYEEARAAWEKSHESIDYDLEELEITQI